MLVFVIILSSCGKGTADTAAPDTSDDTDVNVPDVTSQITCPHEEITVKTHKADILKDGYERVVCKTCGEILDEITLPATKSLKILAIGNSFSVDATTYLYDLFKAAGVEELIVGNAQIGGCSLDKHWTMAQSGDAAYSYTKYTSSGQTTVTCSLKNAVSDEEWDIVTLQQVSNNSGMPETYTHLQDMIDYVLDNCPNLFVNIYFHMTWAYEQSTTHNGFKNYNKDQMTMYNAILDTVQNTVLSHGDIEQILPVGTAIQNLRTSYFGDTLTRDGYHLSLDLGRYTAGLTWVCAITGISPYEVTTGPAGCANVADDLDAIYEAVENAVHSPFEVTQSTHLAKKELTLEERFTSAGLNINDYELLDWEPKLFYHWNSTSRSTVGKSDSLPNYIASKKFTKSELPSGTVIVVDDGYKYRPEGWQKADAPLSGTRPSATTAIFTVVDDEWWGDFNYRAFNVSKVSGSEPATEEDTTHFKIYILKTQGE